MFSVRDVGFAFSGRLPHVAHDWAELVSTLMGTYKGLAVSHRFFNLTATNYKFFYFISVFKLSARAVPFAPG